ncbi:MAG TPA: IS110 family transposase [Actinomycetota bacterium]
MIFVGIDWAEAHHDVCVLDEVGVVQAKGRVPDGVEGVARLHAMVADHAEDAAEVLVGIETDRGLLVGALVAAGYRVYAVNPFAVSRYRDRHGTSGAKSDPGDAKVLANLVRTDRHNHREVAGDSELAEAVKVLARAHQSLIWTRQRQVSALRGALREFYPAALRALPELGTVEACSILGMAPTPERGRRLTLAKVRRSLAASGRTRNLDRRAAEILEALLAPQLEAPPILSEAYGSVVGSLVVVIDGLLHQIARLETELAERFERHPDAEILRSLPGLGLVLGARVLAEFGDDPARYADPKARKNYAGTSPITRASGKRMVVLARVAHNRRLADACYLWAFASLNASPGARRYYDARRTAGKTHHQALRALANRLVGIFHGCLQHRQLHREEVAWPTGLDAVA